MATIIPVRFAYAARDLWFDPGVTGAQEGDHLICSTERGTEIGLATSGPCEVTRSVLGKKTGNSALKPVLRVATEKDLEQAEVLARMGDEAMPIYRKLVAESGLDIKPVGVEYLFGRERAVCYFAAEDRVDFRQLVRSLSHELHERIDMRQIGVREEAAIMGGFGHCGQELCCSRFGLSFEPVSIRMAKEQDLPLTSNKISGACGRLMCCLRYEFEAYRDFKSRAPKRNAVIDTPLGKAKIVEYNTPKEQLALRLENGKTVRVPLAEMIASEAAVKKSEELNCPCRPDTVVRETLDKLNSPDVQMALADLDRKMGVVKEEEFSSEDLFVAPKPRKRSGRSGANASQGNAGSETREASSKPTRRRRRRTTKQADGNVAPQQGQQQNQNQKPKVSQEGQGEKQRIRRRRRRRSNANAPTQANQAAQVEEKTKAKPRTSEKPSEQPKESKPRRRRRHRSAEGQRQAQQQKNGQGQGKAQQEQQPRTANQKEQRGEKRRQRRPRRRPGDHGGQNAQS